MKGTKRRVLISVLFLPNSRTKRVPAASSGGDPFLEGTLLYPNCILKRTAKKRSVPTLLTRQPALPRFRRDFLVGPSAEKTQEVQKEIDKVQIKRQCADDGQLVRAVVALHWSRGFCLHENKSFGAGFGCLWRKMVSVAG